MGGDRDPGRRGTLARPAAGRDAKGRLTGSLRMLLSPEQERAIREAWAAGATRDEAARAAGVSVGRIRQRLADQLADLPRPGRGAAGKRRASPPTEQEIHERAAMLRRSWPPDRWLGHEPGESS